MELIEGIIIKTNKYQENSKVAFIVTKNGLINPIIKGSLEYKSKNFAYSNELTKIEFCVVNSKKNSFDILSNAKVIDTYKFIKLDYDVLYKTSKLLELTYKVINHISNPLYLYNLLDYVLTGINESNEYIDLYVLIFKLKLLYLLGLSPIVNCCARCGKISKKYDFSIVSGGFVCPNCSDSSDIKSDYLDILKILYLGKLDKLNKEFLLNVPKDCISSLQSIISSYYNTYL